MHYQIRSARMDDLQRIQEIYAYARAFMVQTGNPTQWGEHYPPVQMIISDIQGNSLYVIEDEDIIHGVFYFCIEDDLTYHVIEDGRWRAEKPYGVIHRVAGDGSGGILGSAVSFAWRHIHHLRIDTHHDNLVMQKALEKQGFLKRGLIYLTDGSPRIAYDRI